jgi:hypothetical protein
MIAVNITYVVVAAIIFLMALWRASQARRAWAGRPVVATVQRTAAAQAVILIGAALVVGVEAAKPATSARPGSAAMAVGAVGVIVVLAGGIGAVLIVTAGRPRFMIPPQLRTGVGALAAPARGRPPGMPPVTSDATTESDEDALLARAVGGLGAGAATAAPHLRKSVKEINLTMHLPPGQVAARARQVIADLGALVQRGNDAHGGAVRVVGIIGAGALNMNPAVVTVVIRPAGPESSVIVRGAAKEGLIKQRAGQDAARRVADALAPEPEGQDGGVTG